MVIGIVRIAGVVVLCLVSWADPERGVVVHLSQDVASDCISRESQAPRLKQVDPENAAKAVIARCNNELRAADNALLTKYTGYHDEVQPYLHELNTARRDRARKLIALACIEAGRQASP